jgi:hypothetical protein
MGKEKYNKEELIRLLIHEGKSYKEVAAMRGDGSTGEAIRKAANRYGIKVSDRKKLRKCEYCGKEHDGSFGSGRFCCSDCAKKYSLSFSKGKKPEDKSTKEEKVEESVKIAPPKECTTELSRFDGKLTSDLLGYVGECATMFQLARVGIMSSKPCGVDRYDVIADIGEYFINMWFSDNNLLDKVSSEKLIKEIEGRELGEKHLGVYIDFVLELDNNVYWIEYNGKQHYEYQDKSFFHTSYNEFLRQVSRDFNVKAHCKNNNIVFIEIPYTYDTYEKISNILYSIFIEKQNPLDIIKVPEIKYRKEDQDEK